MTDTKQKLSQYWRTTGPEAMDKATAAKEKAAAARERARQRKEASNTMAHNGRIVEKFNPDKFGLWI